MSGASNPGPSETMSGWLVAVIYWAILSNLNNPPIARRIAKVQNGICSL